MTRADLVERLAAHRTLGAVPRNQLEWLASRGRVREFAAGDIVIHADSLIPDLYVVLSGLFTIKGNQAVGFRKLAEWRGGDVTGRLPYSRMGGSPGNVIAEQPSEALLLDGDCFPEMIRECHELTSQLVHVMVDRARFFRSNELHDEKMHSLGRLAAGLAHELNNPASAVARSAKSLAASLARFDLAARDLGAVQPSASQLASIAALRDRPVKVTAGRPLSPLELADLEDDIAQWLGRHGVRSADASALADAGIGVDVLESLSAALDPSILPFAAQYLAASYGVRRLTSDIETAASRIHSLVSAVKGFTYMDQATVPKPVDVGRGVVDTVTMLTAKARAKGVELTYEIEPGLPAAEGFGGELNQVWANLIDNAIDAVAKGGHVTVAAGRERDSLVVRVIDDGPGVPAELRDRIFEPFFTTKDVGDGTGLGLDIARRLIQRHEGMIEVASIPGRTEFRVVLPIAGAGRRDGAQARG